MNNTVAMIVPDESSTSLSDSSNPSTSLSNPLRLPLATIPNNQAVYRIHSRITKPKPFKPYDASKPFISPLKKPIAKIVEEETQEILPAIDSNSSQAPRIIVENCSNCHIEVKITMK